MTMQTEIKVDVRVRDRAELGGRRIASRGGIQRWCGRHFVSRTNRRECAA